jgi:hypothetical protein
MAQAVRADIDPETLHQRLAGVRRRLRLVVLWRGLGRLLSVALLLVLTAGLLDWYWHLPSLVRAVFLVGGLVGGGVIAYRSLLQPLAAKADDLTLALRIEERYPALNDCLASTVEFLNQPDDSETFGSPSLRREAVRRSLRRFQGCDFNEVIDSRGAFSAGLSMIALGAIAAMVIVLRPEIAWTAVQRLANPFGGLEWPLQTRLELEVPRRQIGRNEAFEVRGVVRGVIPEQATVVFQFDGPQVEQACSIVRSEDGPRGTFVARLEAGRVQRNFTFQVRANDAVSERCTITVLPPPLLVPLNGRASPQVRLRYPNYTDLPPTDLPDGAGNVEAVAGTVVSLRAAADRPLARAWIEHQPEPRGISAAAFLGPLGADHTAAVWSLTAAGQAVWDRVPATLGADPRQLSVQFLPRVSGLYVLHFEDENGLRNSRLFELRILPDPSPVVTLERPTASRDSLALLPEAEFTLQVLAEDPVFAVRSVALEYRCRKGDPPRRLSLYDTRSAEMGLGVTLSALAHGPVLLPPPHLRLQQVHVTRRLPVALFRHLDPASSPLKEGDILTLQAVADDFDDVSVDKLPGRSHEIEIRIIGRTALDIALNKDQAKIQQELVKLREQERDALGKVSAAEPDWKRQGKLTPEEVNQLIQAEQLQQQIRERIGETKEDGLRAEVAKLLETLKDNQVPRSAVHERMEAVQAELERLAREELPQIEPRLTDVRKENEAPGKKDQNRLTEARQHQEEVEKTLNDLLQRLEPWTSTQEIKGEAKSILQEQKRLNQETEDLGQQKAFRANKPDDLNDQQRAELEKLRQAQQKLQERMGQLLEKMDRISQDRKDKDPDTARELQKASELGKSGNITGQMQDARNDLAKNNLNKASRDQRESIKNLENFVKELEDRREAELDRLAKKLREAEKELKELEQQQEELQKKVKEAAAIGDPQKRAEELKRLSKEQEKLQKKTEEMVQQLTRLRAGRASQALGKANSEMGQAGQQLQQGDDAEDKQDEALDRLNEARREVKRALGDAEEELAREQLGKIADQLKRLKERQEGHITEGNRLQKEVQERKGWVRPLLFSLNDLSAAQKALGDETAKLAKDKLSDTLVFSRIMKKASRAMEQASERLTERYKRVKDKPEDTKPDEETVKFQQEAVRRLDQLLEAIKQEPGVPQRAMNPGADEPGQPGSQPGGDIIPPLAQLKLLRAMQVEINKKTEDFARQHPDPKQLTEKDKAELQAIRRDQQEVADLLDELTQGDEPEGEKP